MKVCFSLKLPFSRGLGPNDSICLCVLEINIQEEQHGFCLGEERGQSGWTMAQSERGGSDGEGKMKGVCFFFFLVVGEGSVKGHDKSTGRERSDCQYPQPHLTHTHTFTPLYSVCDFMNLFNKIEYSCNQSINRLVDQLYCFTFVVILVIFNQKCQTVAGCSFLQTPIQMKLGRCVKFK